MHTKKYCLDKKAAIKSCYVVNVITSRNYLEHILSIRFKVSEVHVNILYFNEISIFEDCRIKEGLFVWFTTFKSIEIISLRVIAEKYKYFLHKNRRIV